MFHLARLGLTIALAGLVIGPPAAGAPPALQDRVYVAVADSKGKPLTGLTAADFTVAINDTTQESISVAAATDPLSVVIITDRLGLEPAYNNFVVHHALAGFVKAIRSELPGSQFALTTFDGPLVRVSGFSSHAAAFDKSLERLATNASQSVLLDALIDACDVLNEATGERRAIFAVYAGYRQDASRKWNDTGALALWGSKASLWAIEVRSTSTDNVGSAGREQIVDRGSAMSGGMSDGVASAVGLDSSAASMGALLAKQYVITYGPGGDGSTGSRRKVTVNRKGARVLAPTWAPK
jgi:hypothetical protein